MKRPVAAAKDAPTLPKSPFLEVRWDPKDGKGAVIHHTASGDRYHTCFQCGYPKYTGGLVIGNYNGSGFGFYPRRPIRGHKRINLFCAQDESIWDIDEGKEYTYGWSENFGKGDDGVPLHYLGGKILVDNGKEVVLKSSNGAGCYHVSKVAYTRAESPYWIIATRIDNTCSHPLHFDFFSGDDPWLGLYKTSDGDVGWTPEGLVQNETHFGLGMFSGGGIYDLGNAGLGQSTADFTNQANFIRIDPASPLPNKNFFANAFAHDVSEIDPSRPLDNKTMTALNMGWTDRRLSPGEGFTIAMALGRADTGPPGTIPAMPAVSEQEWSVWRRYLNEDPVYRKAMTTFAAETVDIDIGDRQATITGTYWVRTTGSGAAVGIVYPIITATDRPAPTHIEVDGDIKQVVNVTKSLSESRFSVTVPDRGIVRFQVKYVQPYKKNRVTYMVTSANRWPLPLTRARFTVRHKKSFTNVQISYPSEAITMKDDEVVHHIIRQPFSPDREMDITFDRPIDN